MMTNAKRRKPWQGRVSDYRASDLTVRAWCEKNGVTENELRYWLARIDEESPGSERCEVEPARAPRKAVAEAGCVSRRRSIETGQQSHCAFDQAVRDRREELAFRKHAQGCEDKRDDLQPRGDRKRKRPEPVFASQTPLRALAGNPLHRGHRQSAAVERDRPISCQSLTLTCDSPEPHLPCQGVGGLTLTVLLAYPPTMCSIPLISPTNMCAP